MSASSAIAMLLGASLVSGAAAAAPPEVEGATGAQVHVQEEVETGDLDRQAGQEPASQKALVSLDAVQVTAQRRMQSIQDVPLSVTAISTEQLREKGIVSLGDLSGGVIPGVMAVKGAAQKNQIGFNIRGVTVSDPGQGTSEQGSGVYIDGVYLGRAQGLGLDLVEPERIEVLRGPQGTLFGRNTEGGAIQIVTAKPTGEFGMSTTASVADYGQRRVVSHINLPRIGDLAVKVDLLRAKSDGFTKNSPRQSDLSAQRNFEAFDDWGGRVALRWTPSDALVVDYSYDKGASDFTSPYWHRLFTPLGNRSVDNGRLDRSVMPTWNDWSETNASGHALTVEYQGRNGTVFKSISAFRELYDLTLNQTAGANSFARLSGPPATSAYARTGLVAGSELDQNQFSQEFQATGQIGDSVIYTSGLYHYRERATDSRFSGYTIFYTAPGPSNPISTDPVYSGPTVQSAETISSAIYANAAWTPHILQRRLEIGLGVRYTDDNKEVSRTVSGGIALQQPLTPEPFETKRWDPALSARYSITDKTSAYMRYATGYRSGGVSVRSPSFRVYNEEEVASVEVGLKSDLLDNRLRLNAAIYRNEIDGFQSTVGVDPVNVSLTDTLNMSEPLIAKGLELEFIARPTERLEISGNYAYQKVNTPIHQAPSGAIDRLWQPIVPKHSGGMSVNYGFGNIGDAQLVGRVDWQYMSEYFRPTVVTAARLHSSALNMLNARITLRDIRIDSIAGDLSVSIFGRNLMDKEDVMFASSEATTYTPPRYVGVEATLAF